MMSIRRAQATAIERMFGKEPAQAHKTPSWKAFVYDSHGMNVISPLLNVAELRDLGVTVHYRINLSREPLPDVEAVYMCLPTQDNVKRIIQDMRENVYGWQLRRVFAMMPHSDVTLLCRVASIFCYVLVDLFILLAFILFSDCLSCMQQSSNRFGDRRLYRMAFILCCAVHVMTPCSKLPAQLLDTTAARFVGTSCGSDG
eukprot:m.31578 g.31578  ORF g.31578 m.31578 type:complete len:200 (-) comp9433_c0_seq1:1719-2318(-)